MKLLIIEDETDLAKALQRGFKKSGYESDFVSDGRAGYELYLLNAYDLIVLDLNLPSMDGIEILKRIRQTDKLQRIIVLSARSAIEDRIAGLNLGANDYLAKPFDFGELNARVGSLLRRSFIQESNQMVCGAVSINFASKTIAVLGEKMETTAKEYAIMEYLALHAGQTVSAEELIEHVWSSEADFFTASVKVHISNLRRKLKARTGKEIIETARGQGYRMEKGGEFHEKI